MEQDQGDLEEGEIHDDDDEIYVPLKRPQNYALDVPQKRFPIDTQYTDSEEDEQSSGSDSDLDIDTRKKNKKPKKIKVIPKPLHQHHKSDRAKKYDIWSTRVQDVLAETMNSCDVTKKDRSRDVESYDYDLPRRLYAAELKYGLKRTRDDRKNPNFRQQKKENDLQNDVKSAPRIIPDLNITETSEIDDIAKDIANKLCEEREDLILKVLGVIGKEKTIELFKETRRLEKEGGMLIMNQTRRRTPGGVFLFLVRHGDLTAEQRQEIFSEDRQKYNKALKEKRKQKYQILKNKKEDARAKLLPELLTRAELLAKQNPTRKLKETDDTNCTNPPPSPETDHHESGDGMDSGQLVISHSNRNFSSVQQGLSTAAVSSTNKVITYDDDFLDLSSNNDMDLF